MPVVVAIARSVLAKLVFDAVRAALITLAGLLCLALIAGQSMAIATMASTSARAEFYRALLTGVAMRTAVAIRRDPTGKPVLDPNGEYIVEPEPPDPASGDPRGMTPIAFLMALAQVNTDFDPLYNCRDPLDPARPPPDVTVRRGLLAVDPLRFRTLPFPETAQARWQAVRRHLRRAPAEGGAPLPDETRPPEAALCDAEANAVAGVLLIGAYRWGAENEVEGVNGAYRALVEEYRRAMERYEAELREWRRCERGQAEDGASGLSPRACPREPSEPDQPVPPTPSCVQPELRTVDRPTIESSWEQEEMICQVMRRWTGGGPGRPGCACYERVWLAMRAWEAELARPITRPEFGLPAGGDVYAAPPGSTPYAVSEAVRYAMTQLGQPYVWGGDGPEEGGFDCSGLVFWAFGKAGIRLPRVAQDQFDAVTDRGRRPIPRAQLDLGDLVFYSRARDVGAITHVGIYVGNGRMLNAPSEAAPIRVEPIWPDTFVGGGRVYPERAASPGRARLRDWMGGRVFPITQAFNTLDPTLYRSGYHTGIDFGAPVGTPLTAGLPGRVVRAGPDGGYGQAIAVETEAGQVILGHLSDIVVAAGQPVGRGQLLGRSGNTGYSTGPHLHLEVRRGGAPVNPASVFSP